MRFLRTISIAQMEPSAWQSVFYRHKKASALALAFSLAQISL